LSTLTGNVARMIAEIGYRHSGSPVINMILALVFFFVKTLSIILIWFRTKWWSCIWLQ